MASMRERKPGVWELRAYLGGGRGSSRQVSRTFRGTAKQAEVALARLVLDVDEGLHDPEPEPDPDDPTVGEWCEDWFARMSSDWSPTSASTARNHLDHHILPAFGATRLADLRLRDIDLWIRRDLVDTKGLAPATVSRIVGVLKTALEQAARWEVIAKNPAQYAQLPKRRYVESRTPTAAELVHALEAAPDIHSRTLVWLAAATGARRGQLVALQWGDIDADAGVVTFHRAAIKVDGGVAVKEPKGGRPIQAALDDGTLEVVRAYRVHRQEQALAAGIGRLSPRSFIFAQDPAGKLPWYPDTASVRWREVRGLAGLDGVRLHDLRHAHATLLIAAGVDRRTVASRLGHAQVSTTDRYTHQVSAADRAAAEIMGGLLGG